MSDGGRSGRARVSAMSVISFARGIPGPDLLPSEAFGACAKAAAEKDGARALNYGPPSGLSAAARLGRGAARRRSRPRRAHDRLAPGLQLRRARRSRPRTRPSSSRRPATTARSASCAASAPGRLDSAARGRARRGRARGRGRGDARAEADLHDPDLPEPERKDARAEESRRLLELARETGSTILEDDPYGLLRFDGESIPTLFELAAATASSSSARSRRRSRPGIRVGYVILPEDLVGAIEQQVLENYVSPSIFVQAALDEFATRGSSSRTSSARATACAIRRDAMLAALEREAPEGTRWNRPEGGYFLWLDLPAGVNAAELLDRATAAGVTFVKGSDFFLGPGGEESARLAFSFATADEIDEGIVPPLRARVREGRRQLPRRRLLERRERLVEVRHGDDLEPVRVLARLLGVRVGDDGRCPRRPPSRRSSSAYSADRDGPCRRGARLAGDDDRAAARRGVVAELVDDAERERKARARARRSSRRRSRRPPEGRSVAASATMIPITAWSGSSGDSLVPDRDRRPLAVAQDDEVDVVARLESRRAP